MKSAIPLPILLLACILSGCTTPGQTYAKQHSELPPKQLEFLKTGKVPDGDAIAGMTREQVQIAMGIEPTQYAKIDGHDAWVYVRKKLGTNGVVPNVSEMDHEDRRNSTGSMLGSLDASAQNQGQVRTTIYFDGNVVTHAESVNGGL
jgi:outer membrane protein assembly factor BamE (lipoprotein component of BamABCDE complex)